jgi:hypothetical protein
MLKLMLDPDIKGATGGGAGVTPASSAAVPPAPSAAAASAPAPVASEPAKPAAPAAPPAADPKSPWMKEPEKKAEKFALKVPEGASIEAAALEKFGAEYQSLGLTQDQAQKLLERHVAEQKAQNEAIVSQMKAQNAQWQKEHQARHGQKYGEIGENLKRVFDYGDPDGSFRKGLEAMEMANHPQLLAFVERFIPLFKEESLKQPSTLPPAPTDSRTPMERLTAKYADRFKAGTPR